MKIELQLTIDGQDYNYSLDTSRFPYSDGGSAESLIQEALNGKNPAKRLLVVAAGCLSAYEGEWPTPASEEFLDDKWFVE